MSRGTGLAMVLLLGCSSEALEAQPRAGDRPPPIADAMPIDPTWPTTCGSARLLASTGACLEGAELTVPLRFTSGQRTRSVTDGAYLLSAVEGHDYPLPNGGSKADEQMLQLELPSDATDVSLPLSISRSPTMLLRVTSSIGTPVLGGQGNPAGSDVQADHWDWRSSNGSIVCRAAGTRVLCEFHDVRFVLEGGDRTSRPGAFPTTFDVEGWLYVLR